MKKLLLALASVLFLAIPLYAPRDAQAVPAFARQTGMACNTCHFQHYPALNAFGRAFKAGGFTMVGGQSLVEGDLLSIPSTLNASVVTKLRYQKTNGDDDDSGTNRGELQFPDEAALLIGGRVGEHIGFILEAQMADGESPTFASFQIPVGMEIAGMRYEVVPFTTDAFGPQYSFEVLNTGAIRHLRTLEHRRETSAVQYVGAQGEAQGFGFVGWHNTGFVNYTLWQPEVGSSDSAPLLHYVRLAATPTIAGWDLGVGGQLWAGSTKHGGTTREKAEAWAIDLQAQGNILNAPVGFYASYARADGSNPGETANMFNSNPEAESAWSVLAELGVLPNRVTVAVGYRDGDNGETTSSEQDALTFGATFLLTQNFELQVNHTSYFGNWYDVTANNEGSDGDQLTTLMIFAAF